LTALPPEAFVLVPILLFYKKKWTEYGTLSRQTITFVRSGLCRVSHICPLIVFARKEYLTNVPKLFFH
jgi:hypothetical protein